ncbi:hypothetical protein [Halalkalicoccus salilacus]|uniref:hypothetical protein n=1 Tax=Halalkalicoccus salilacus TaxID=3117459 RepID=UPI00300F3875
MHESPRRGRARCLPSRLVLGRVDVGGLVVRAEQRLVGRPEPPRRVALVHGLELSLLLGLGLIFVVLVVFGRV